MRTNTESVFFNSGVKVLRTSVTGAKAVMTPDIGEVTDLSSPSSFQVVRIDNESLPTGIAIPSAGHISIPIALTPSNKAWSSPF